MQVTERDKIAAHTLTQILKKAKLELEGDEVIVTSRVMEWAVELHKRITLDLTPKTPASVVPPAPVQETPKRSKSKKDK